MKLQKATVSVTVNDNNLTENRKQQLIDTVSKAANIAPEDIVITSFRQTEVQPETVQPEKKETEPQGIVWDRNTLFLAGAGLLILLLLIFCLCTGAEDITEKMKRCLPGRRTRGMELPFWSGPVREPL